MLRKILIAVAVTIVLIVGAGIYVIHRWESALSDRSRAELVKLEPRVVTGAGRFAKTSFYAGSNLGEITQILAGWPADREGATLAVVGKQGVHFLDSGVHLEKEIRFAKRIGCPVVTARLDSSGDYGFLTRNESWAVDVILFDKQGQERWRYEGHFLNSIDDSVMGNLGGDGISKVVIGHNAGGGLVLTDGNGKIIWKKAESNVWHVEILNIQSSGRKVILHSNARGQLLVRDANGEVIAHYLPDHYVSNFSMTRWGTESEPSRILVPTKETGNGCCIPVLLVLDSKGKTVAHLTESMSDLMHEAWGTPVQYANNTRYYAVLESRSVMKRSVLSLYENEGQIVYQEIIGDTCGSIAAVPGRLGERLLVGCSGTVWEYSAHAVR